MEKSLIQLIEALGYRCLAGQVLTNRMVHWGYVSDLLSDVMGKAQPGMVWITSQVHSNIVAVAALKEVAAIIVVNERQVDPDVLAQAEREEVVILSSGMPAFETAGGLYDQLKESD